MRSKEAAEYLGWSRQAIYDRVSRKALPHYKVDGMLLFKRDELDSWLEQYKEAPRDPEHLHVPAVEGRRRARHSTSASASRATHVRSQGSAREKPKKRERPLPPLGGSEEQKTHWAVELEISRVELEEMSPGEFRKAWDARNQRLRDGRVFDHLTEQTEEHGWDVIDKMTASELIMAVADLGLSSAGTIPIDSPP
jgi:excisionase family DNA binding protein